MSGEAMSKGQMVKAFLPLILVFGLRKLPFEEDQLLLVARSVFCVRILLTAAVLSLTALRLRGIPDAEANKIVKAHEKNLGMGQTEMVPEKTVAVYDRDTLIAFTKQQLIQIALIAFLHLKFELVQPLILSSILGLIAFPDEAIFQVYLLNKTLTRPFPFKAPNGLMGLFGGGSATAPAAAETTPAVPAAASNKKTQ